jgi:hypothetical protein
MIYTREQLREELFKIIDRTLYIDYEDTDAQDMEDCKDQLADFISKLNDPYCFAEDETK